MQRDAENPLGDIDRKRMYSSNWVGIENNGYICVTKNFREFKSYYNNTWDEELAKGQKGIAISGS